VVLPSLEPAVFGLNLDQDDIQSMRGGFADVTSLPWRPRIWGMRAGGCSGVTGRYSCSGRTNILGFRSPMGFRVELLRYAKQEALDGFGPL